MVRSVDSSLVDEWENAGNPAALDAAPPQGIDEVVADRRGCTLLVRNALFRRVTLAARGHVRDLGELDEDWGMSEVRWQKALDAYHEQHEEILTNGDARSSAMFTIDESDEKTDHVWHVHQIFADEDGDHDFGIMGDVDLDATKRSGAAGNIASGPAFCAIRYPPTRHPRPHRHQPRQAHRPHLLRPRAPRQMPPSWSCCPR